MDAQKLSFLTAVLGADGAQALNKAVQRYEPLESILLPRAILSWLSITARTGYEGEIPGVPGTVLSFAKNESGLYDGTLSIDSDVHPFENASVMHVVAGVAVALKSDIEGDVGVRDSDLVNLGKQVDLLAKAEFVQQFEPLQKAEIGPKKVTMYHVGRDFDQFDPSHIGTGEGAHGGKLNPLGPGLYGAIAEPGSEEAAKNLALQYAKYHEDPHLHTFEVELDPTGTTFGAHNAHTRDFYVDGLHAKFRALGSAIGMKDPRPDDVARRLGSVRANAVLREHGISAAMTNLGNGVQELAVFDPSKLRRVGKERLQKPTQPIQKSEPRVATKNPKRNHKIHKRFHFTKSQFEVACPDCGIPQIDGGKFTGCMCTSDMVQFASLTKSDTGYTVDFGAEWGEDELSLLFSITGATNG